MINSRVFVAEDEEPILKQCVSALASVLPYTLFCTASTRDDALQAIAAARLERLFFDVAIVDLKMPGSSEANESSDLLIGGWDVMEELRKEPKISDMVIMVTAFAEHEEVVEGRRLRADSPEGVPWQRFIRKVHDPGQAPYALNWTAQLSALVQQTVNDKLIRGLLPDFTPDLPSDAVRTGCLSGAMVRLSSEVARCWDTLSMPLKDELKCIFDVAPDPIVGYKVTWK
jgi:CheY-like chemotaxis protein